MKYIIGILLGIILTSGVVVYAKNTGMQYINTISLEGRKMFVHKVYDNDNGTVCYIAEKDSNTWTSPGISCLK